MANVLSMYDDLTKLIKKGQIEPLYVFYGPEQAPAQFVTEVLKQELVPPGMEELNYTHIEGRKASEAEIVRAIESPPMFADKRLTVIEQPSFAKPRKEASYPLMEALLANWPPYACVVIHATEMDRRTKFVKALLSQAAVFQFSSLTMGEATAWVNQQFSRRRLRVPYGAAGTVVKRCGTDLRLLKLEVEKLEAYAEGKALSAEDLEHLVRDDSETSIFALSDAVGEKKRTEALTRMKSLLAEGASAGYLLFMIGQQVRNLLQARTGLEMGLSEKEIMKSLGFKSEYPAQKCIGQAKRWTTVDLEKAVLLFLEADGRIKEGLLPAESSLLQFVFRLPLNA